MASTYIDQAIITYLLTVSGLSSIIGSRLYHIRAPQMPTLPYGVLTLVSPDNSPVVLGTAAAGTHRFELAFVSKADRTPCQAYSAAQAAVTALRHYSGSMDGVSVRSVLNLSGPDEVADSEFDDRVNCLVSFDVEYSEVV